MILQKLSWVQLTDKPKTTEMDQDRFNTQLQIVLKRMSGEVDPNQRIITYQDLIDLGLI